MDSAVHRLLSGVGRDVRHAVRTLRRAPLFTSVAVACLALGIAANTAMFSVFDAIVLRPLPFAAPEQLVSVGLRDPASGRRTSLRFNEYLAWREAGSFAELAAHSSRGVAITERQDPERVSGRLVSASLFPLLGARAQIGRVLTADDDRLGAGRVVVIGDALWRRRYGGDSSIVGKLMSLDGVSHAIVGVMERGFAFPSATELWMPISPALPIAAAGSRSVAVVGRLRVGVDVRQANMETSAFGERVARQLRPDRASATAGIGDVRPLAGNRLGSDEALIATAMLGATTFLLLIACANVANLTLSRAVAREREIAVRFALGAGRARIVRQLVTESVLIGFGACAVAVPIVWEALRLIKAAIPPSDPFPYYMEWSLDLHTFAFASIASVVSGVLFGVGPAMQATSSGFQRSLKEGGQSTGTSRGRRRVRDGLVIVELALALVLLVGASLFVRTFLGLRRTELGYDASRIMTMRFYLPGARYDSLQPRLAVVDEVLRRVRAIPGVEAATVSDLVPLDDEGGSNGSVVSDAGDRAFVGASYAAIASGWFETLGVGPTAGRTLSAADARAAVPVAVVNQTMARSLWPQTNPIGRRFRFAADSSRTLYEVVGVVPDIRTVKLDEDQRTPPTAYLPLRFVPTRDYGLMVRSRTPVSLTATLRRAIHAADPVVPVFNVWSMEEVRYLSFWMYALWSTMFGAFGLIALILATIGVYGVIHYGVAQRTREIGVRVALGAQRTDVLRLVFGQGMLLAGVGVTVGLLAALALTRVVESLLIGVSSTDIASFVGVAVFLCCVAGLATYIPARRATRVDPLIALRDE